MERKLKDTGVWTKESLEGAKNADRGISHIRGPPKGSISCLGGDANPDVMSAAQFVMHVTFKEITQKKDKLFLG